MKLIFLAKIFFFFKQRFYLFLKVLFPVFPRSPGSRSSSCRDIGIAVFLEASVLSHLSCDEMLFQLKKRRLRRAWSMSTNSWKERAKRTETGTSQWCPVAGLKHSSPFERQRTFSYCEGDRVLEHITQRGGGDSPIGDIQKPSGHSLAQPAPGNAAWAGGMDQNTLFPS